MKKLFVFILVMLLGIINFSGDDPNKKSAMSDCGDCVESEMDAPTGDPTPTLGYSAIYTIPEECDLELDWHWAGSSGLTFAAPINRYSTKVIFLSCPNDCGSHRIRYERSVPGGCRAYSDWLYINPDLSNPVTPSGETNPETYYYYKYSTNEVPVADEYVWDISGGAYGTTGPTDENSIQIIFFQPFRNYYIKVQARCCCDNSAWTSSLVVTTGS